MNKFGYEEFKKHEDYLFEDFDIDQIFASIN